MFSIVFYFPDDIFKMQVLTLLVFLVTVLPEVLGSLDITHVIFCIQYAPGNQPFDSIEICAVGLVHFFMFVIGIPCLPLLF